MKENKQAIIKSLLGTIHLTRAGQDIDRLELSPDEEIVYICYLDGYKVTVPIGGDSGVALILDIANRI